MTRDLDQFAQVEEAARYIAARCGEVPATAIVLGSGLSELADRLNHALTLDFGELPHWPRSTVPGHSGRLVLGELAGQRVAALAGRAHLYEGHSASAVVFGLRVMGRLGVRHIILTNAAGGISTSLTSGMLMVIEDHINLLGANPLAGPNDDRFGPRFPDLTEVYSGRLRALAHETAREKSILLEQGVYAAVQGPSYETPAEIRYLRLIGADAVGMSTVPEAIAARHMGLEVLGLSCITNMAAGVQRQPLSHDDVLTMMQRARGTVATLLEGIVAKL